jgi:EAL domain-containing protein (putative c-di-GMP-specific phosphodiesterase class I)
MEGKILDFDYTMAFQPIVNIKEKNTLAFEALARGPENQSAGYVLSKISQDNIYKFDQTCRVKAIELASRLKIPTKISINFLPNAVYRPDLCIRTTLEACEKYNFEKSNIIFEITEGEKILDHDHLKKIIDYYRQSGFQTAIDDFGAGYSGLNLLSSFQPDYIKIDLALIRDIHNQFVKQSIVKAIIQVCNDLSIKVIAEGIENKEEYLKLQELGIHLMQGYYFGKPEFENFTLITNEFESL